MATAAETCKECQEQQVELLPLDSTNRQSKEHVSQLLSGAGDAVTADKRGSGTQCLLCFCLCQQGLLCPCA